MLPYLCSSLTALELSDDASIKPLGSAGGHLFVSVLSWSSCAGVGRPSMYLLHIAEQEHDCCLCVLLATRSF